MHPSAWYPPVEASPLEQTIITRIKRAKLFIFLRHHRHEIFDDAFQEELETLYTSSLRGQLPIAPAQLALATIVQAYTGVSDDEVIEAPQGPPCGPSAPHTNRCQAPQGPLAELRSTANGFR